MSHRSRQCVVLEMCRALSSLKPSLSMLPQRSRSTLIPSGGRTFMTSRVLQCSMEKVQVKLLHTAWSPCLINWPRLQTISAELQWSSTSTVATSGRNAAFLVYQSHMR
uniref:ZmAO-1 n=1 Tax=Arundo donax TaxID=35708 RepID=A0A0A9GMZ8_ARUDO